MDLALLLDIDICQIYSITSRNCDYIYKIMLPLLDFVLFPDNLGSLDVCVIRGRLFNTS